MKINLTEARVQVRYVLHWYPPCEKQRKIHHTKTTKSDFTFYDRKKKTQTRRPDGIETRPEGMQTHICWAEANSRTRWAWVENLIRNRGKLPKYGTVKRRKENPATKLNIDRMSAIRTDIERRVRPASSSSRRESNLITSKSSNPIMRWWQGYVSLNAAIEVRLGSLDVVGCRRRLLLRRRGHSAERLL